MFVLPFTRFVLRHRTQQPQNVSVTSEAAPLIQQTEDTLSSQAVAREEGNTYASYATDLSETVEFYSAQSQLDSTAEISI